MGPLGRCRRWEVPGRCQALLQAVHGRRALWALRGRRIVLDLPLADLLNPSSASSVAIEADLPYPIDSNDAQAIAGIKGIVHLHDF
jgi:hypothetical protein